MLIGTFSKEKTYPYVEIHIKISGSYNMPKRYSFSRFVAAVI